MPTSTLPPLTPRPNSLTSIRQYLSDGQRLYDLGRFDAAIQAFDQIKLQSFAQPEDRQAAYTWQAKSHVALGNWNEALLAVGEALAIDPTSVEGYRHLVDAYKTLNVERFRLRATIYMELNSHEAAILAFNQVISRDPAPTAGDYNSRGYARYMRKQYAGAIADLTEAILIEPTRERFELRGASNYYSGKDVLKVRYQAALSDFEQAIRMGSTSNLIEWRSLTHSKLDQFK
jgi:tetratricopeptide (TPR) repeat protein